MRVVRLAPLVLLLSPSRTLEPRVEALRELGVPDDLLGSLVVRTPRLLHSPIEAIRAKVRWLYETSVLSSDDAPGVGGLGGFLRLQPDYLSFSTRECARRLEWLTSLGLDEARAASTIRAEPGLLSMSLEQLQLRASFFLRVVGGTVDELSAVPHMLTCDLAKGPMLRHAYCLSNGMRVEPTQLLLKNDALFCMEVAGCSLAELLAFEASGKHLAFYQGAEM